MIINPFDTNSVQEKINQAGNEFVQQINNWSASCPPTKAQNLKEFLAFFRQASDDLAAHLQQSIDQLHLITTISIILICLLGFWIIFYLIFNHQYVFALSKYLILKFGQIIHLLLPKSQTTFANYQQQTILLKRKIFAGVSIFNFNLLKPAKLKLGSALIIALLTTAVISSIGFGVGRLMISEIKQSSRIEDSILAYYAAESGIEQALLLWRYNRNVEIPKDNMSKGIKKAMRVYLDNLDYKMDADIDIPDENAKTRAYYDLRVWYKNNNADGQSQEIVCSQKALDDPVSECSEALEEGLDIVNTYDDPALVKDNTVQYDVRGLKNIELKWEFEREPKVYYDENGKRIDERDKFLLEFIPINEDGEIVEGLKKVYHYDDRKRIPPISLWASLKDIKTIRLRVFGENLKEYSITADAPASDSPKMSSRFTTIDSIGYFGTSKRRLKIQINRFSKTIFGPYDMVIYQGGDETPTPSPNPSPTSTTYYFKNNEIDRIVVE